MKFLILIIIVSLGIITSYEDTKFDRIRNKWILLGFLFGIIINFFLFLQDPWGQLWGDFFTNTIISFLIGFFLWKYKYWPAGDAKLFFVFSLLIPLEYYKNSYFKYFPAFNLLVNIFVPMFLIIIIRAVMGMMELISLTNIKGLIELFANLKKHLLNNGKEYLQAFMGFSMMFLILQMLKSSFGNKFKSFAVIYLLLFYIYKPLYIFFSKEKKVLKILNVVFLIYFSYVLINYPSMLLKTMHDILKMVIVFMVCVSAINKVIEIYNERMEITKVKICELKEGDVFTERSLNSIKEKLTEYSFYADGVSNEGIKQMKEVFDENGEIEIYKTIPFASVMFIGVLITLIFKTSIIHLALQFGK